MPCLKRLFKKVTMAVKMELLLIVFLLSVLPRLLPPIMGIKQDIHDSSGKIDEL